MDYGILAAFLISMALTFYGSYQIFVRIHQIGYKAGAQELISTHAEEIIPLQEEPVMAEDSDDYKQSVESYLGNI